MVHALCRTYVQVYCSAFVPGQWQLGILVVLLPKHTSSTNSDILPTSRVNTGKFEKAQFSVSISSLKIFFILIFLWLSVSGWDYNKACLLEMKFSPFFLLQNRKYQIRLEILKILKIITKEFQMMLRITIQYTEKSVISTEDLTCLLAALYNQV
jgi:hypothetical protein